VPADGMTLAELHTRRGAIAMPTATAAMSDTPGQYL
jgi:hypothetical protein